MDTDRTPHGMDTMNLHEVRRHNRTALIYGGLSIVAALLCGWLLRNTQPGVAGRIVLALIPVIPSALYVFSVVRATRVMDELYQRIQLEAVTFAFVGSLIVSLTYGMLQKSGFFRQWPWDWEGIWCMLIGLWMVGNLIVARRYQ